MRRRALPVAVASLALGGSGLVAAPASAAPDGWPDGSWAACADEAAEYCVESATVTPEGADPVPLAEAGLSSSVGTLPGYATSFNWSVEGLDGAGVSDAVRAGSLRLVIRVGQFVPRYT